MILESLLTELSTRGIHLEVDGDRLMYEAPTGAQTGELRAWLVEHKQDLLQLIRVRTFRRELCAAVGRLSANFTYTEHDTSLAHARAQDADAELDRSAENVDVDLAGALRALRRWERAWAAAGVPRASASGQAPTEC